MGCDVAPSILNPIFGFVSIHAPAWGATSNNWEPSPQMGVSIHAPAWGATVPVLSPVRLLVFQSTHPHGVRPTHIGRADEVFSVSIHAPAWGATKPRRRLSRHYWFQSTHPHGVRLIILINLFNNVYSFNPRTRMGCDGQYRRNIVPAKGFQSTHPHGVRRCGSIAPNNRKCFNPRTRMGCDIQLQHALSLLIRVSIHAPAWGATKRSNRPFRDERVSIHAPAWGATNFQPQVVATRRFQSTHPHGVRLFWFFCLRLCKHSFNPRTRMGCDSILSNELNIIVQIYRICE